MTDAQSAQRAYRDYLESRVANAHPVEIVHMLYRVAIDNLNLAVTHLNAGDAFARARAVTKAELAVNELTLALDHTVGAPFTRTLADLYDYVLRQTIQGHGKKDEQAFRDALAILTTLAEGWDGVRQKVCGENSGVESTSAPSVEREAPAPRTQEVIAGVGLASRFAAYSQTPVAVAEARDWSC
jgi:flagellar protein FliS